jgi:arsenate reductase
VEKLGRAILVAAYYGLIGVLFGAATGCVVGAVTGLIFGGVWDGIVFGIFVGMVINGFALAVTGILLDDADSLEPSWRSKVSKPAVLFLCTNNAARSQMAEGLLRKKAAEHFDAYSAGTEPKEIHPLAIKVMSEVGIDLSGQQSKDLRTFLGRLPVRVAIFVCQKAEVKCPAIWPGALARMEWPLEDPAAVEGNEDERIAKFRSIRDQIDQKITTWLAELSTVG